MKFHESSMVTPTRKFGPVFYPSLSIFYEDHNKECSLTKYEQISKCGFEEISTQCLKIHMELIISKQVKEEDRKQTSKH